MAVLIPNFDDNLIDYDADPIVQLTRIFRNQELPTKLVILNQVPNLRHHIQNAGLTGISIWNAFDVIQDIQVTEAIPLGVEDLVFPVAALPSYREDAVRYYADGKLYATVNLRGEGYVWTVNYPEQDGITVIEQYDDRGFLSTRIWETDDDAPNRQEWYNFNGDLVMQQVQTGKVLVDAKLHDQLGQAEFENLAQVIAQVTNQYLANQSISLAIGELTPSLAVLRPRLKQVERMILLIRNPQTAALQLVTDQDLLVVPTQTDLNRLTKLAPQKTDTQVLATQPTELDLGISNEIPLMEIDWLTGDAPVSFVDKTYNKIMPMIARTEDKSLHVLVNDKQEAERLQSILEAWVTSDFGVDLHSEEFNDLKKYLVAKEKERVTVDMEKKMEERKKLPSWEPMVNAYMMLKRVTHDEVPTLSGMQYQMSRARIFVDSHVKPVTDYQILAVSAAIPQINRARSDYLVDGQNGQVVADESQLVNAISHYLDTLSNWNQQVVFNAQLIEKNSEEELFHQWEEVLAWRR